MSEPIRTTWRDARTRLIHAVTIEGIRPGDGGRSYAEEIRTDCGILVPTVTLDDDGDVTCGICLESGWLEEVTEQLPAEPPVPA